MSRAQVSIVKSKSSPNTTEIDEAEIAKLVSDGGLKPNYPKTTGICENRNYYYVKM